jgi:hypothetical protein
MPGYCQSVNNNNKVMAMNIIIIIYRLLDVSKGCVGFCTLMDFNSILYSYRRGGRQEIPNFNTYKGMMKSETIQ